MLEAEAWGGKESFLHPPPRPPAAVARGLRGWGRKCRSVAPVKVGGTSALGGDVLARVRGDGGVGRDVVIFSVREE